MYKNYILVEKIVVSSRSCLSVYSNKKIIMKKILFTAVFLIAAVCAMYSQEKQIVIMTANDYGAQRWFYSGSGNKLQTDKIKELYNQDYYITSVAYTANGWFVCMSKNAGLTGQSYYYIDDWPTEWLSEKESAGYYITSISHGNGKWMFVVSKGTGYTDQTWKWDTWENVAAFIKNYWDKDYDITQAEYMNNKWLVVMSKNTQYTSQSYATRSTYEDAKEKISQFWNDGKRLQFIEYGGGKYFIVASKLKSGKVPAQSYSTRTSRTKEFISEGWDEGKSLAYIGGGYSEQPKPIQSQTTTYAHNHNHAHNNNGGKRVVTDATVPYMNGYTRNVVYSDGSGYTETNIPCTSLHCSNGLCTMCRGTGIFVHPIVNTSMPCSMCNFGKCKYCNGQGRIITKKYWAPGEASAYLQAQQQVNNSNSNSNSNHNSSSHSSGVCPDCGGKGYRPQAYTYAAQSSFAPYHNYSGNQCPICSQYTDHYHYRCTTCKRH